MRKFKLLTLLAATLMTANMWAQGPWTSGSCTVTLDGNTMTVTGSGAMATNYTTANYQPWKSYRSGVTTIVISSGVTSIGKNCFASFTDLTTVTIASSVTSLGNTAFNGCSSLASVTFSSATPPTLGTNVFRSASSSLKLYVPDANAQAYSNAWLDYIGKIYCATSGNPAPAPHGEGDFGAAGNNLHWDFTGSTLTITGSGDTGELDYTDLPWKAFNSLIKTVYLPDGITHISSDAFFSVAADEVHIGANPADLEWDEDGDDFKDAGEKTTLCYVPVAYLSAYNIKFPEVNVSFTVAPWTSGDCEVALAGSTITVSGAGAMADYANASAQPWADFLSGVTTIVVEDGVTHIGNYAFDGCSNVDAIQTKSATPPTLGTNAFNGHAANVEISAYPCLSYASYVSAWNVFEEESFTADCVAPDNSCGNGLIWEVSGTTLTITKAYVGDGAMKNYSTTATKKTPWNSVASTLTSIEIGNGVTTIGNYAFYDCTNASLTAITIPASVTSIGTFSFSTTKITEVTIPANVVSIADYAFSNCYNLITVNMLPTTAPTAGGTNIFSYSTVAAIIYPCGSSESYEAAWSDYASLSENCGGPVGPKVDDITANGDPERPGVYYSTYYSNKAMALPNNGTEAYVATLSGGEMLLTKIAEGAQVLPANTAVILRGPSASFNMTESDESPVSFSATNNLKGSMSVTATANNLYQQYYVLSGHSSDNEVQGVGFYKYDGSIPAQKAYLIILSNGNAAAPKRVRFIFEEEQQATGIDNSNVETQATKFIENGMLIIEKNGVRYNAQGQIVK